jgi:hypothetical protein
MGMCCWGRKRKGKGMLLNEKALCKVGFVLKDFFKMEKG